MKNAELLFIPLPAIGHLVSMVEMAKLLLSRSGKLSITVLLTKFAIDTGIDNYTQSLLTNTTPRLRILELPEINSDAYMSKPANAILPALFEAQKPNVRDILIDIVLSESTQLAGFVVDFLCINIMDIANEFKLPTYVYCPASAAFLGLMFHLQSLRDDHKQELTQYRNSNTELVVPSFANPVPAKVLPSMFLDKEGESDLLLSMARRYRQTKGIIINTFAELESNAIDSLKTDDMIPPVYSVGPILNLNGGGQNSDEASVIMRWLDDQPPSSVLFLCFGSFGGFQDDQVKEIALALARSGHRFLWALRPSFKRGDTKLPGKFTNLDEVLPAGFLERTAGIGRVIGWAPQVSVLSHPAVGGFMSHCGWNSTLESVWFGVPVATWSLYAEQQLNAFEMVNELGLAVDIETDHYHKNGFNSLVSDVVVKAEEIETKIRKLMMVDDNTSGIRNQVKEMKEKSRLTMLEKGSSYTSLGKLIEEIIN